MEPCSPLRAFTECFNPAAGWEQSRFFGAWMGERCRWQPARGARFVCGFCTASSKCSQQSEMNLQPLEGRNFPHYDFVPVALHRVVCSLPQCPALPAHTLKNQESQLWGVVKPIQLWGAWKTWVKQWPNLYIYPISMNGGSNGFHPWFSKASKGEKSPLTHKSPPAHRGLHMPRGRRDHGLEPSTGTVLAVMNPDSCEREQWNDVSTMRVRIQALCKVPFLQEDRDFQDLCKEPRGCGGTAACSTGSASANPAQWIRGSPLQGPALRQQRGFNESTKVKTGVFLLLKISGRLWLFRLLF